MPGDIYQNPYRVVVVYAIGKMVCTLDIPIPRPGLMLRLSLDETSRFKQKRERENILWISCKSFTFV